MTQQDYSDPLRVEWVQKLSQVSTSIRPIETNSITCLRNKNSSLENNLAKK
jgi:hypothetical protein